MISKQSFLSFLFIPIAIFFLIISPGYFLKDLIALPRLSHVSPEMEKPGFWIKKIRNPTHRLLTPEKIQEMNEENLTRSNLLLCRVRDLKEVWSREEILSFLQEDWANFGRTGEVRYGRNKIPLDDYFWSELRNNLNQESIQERRKMLFGLIVKRTDIRVFPTDEPSIGTPYSDGFDLFQHSSISMGSPIGIYHFSKDTEWAYVQTPFIRGWVRTHHLAIAKVRDEVLTYEEAKEKMVVTGNFINIFGNHALQQPVSLSQMGDSFPLLSKPGRGEKFNPFYIIQIPSREDNGKLTFRKGYLRAEADVHQGFLPYTQENVARQAFKMLNHPYGWGDKLGGRDCSRFIMDLFRTFGFRMPRNSREQAILGTDLFLRGGKKIREKEKLLDQAIPLTTTLYLPGHIMLYLGKDQGRYYAIHSIWGIQTSGSSGPILEKIGRVVVSDLDLGKKGPYGSLWHRITDVHSIGPSSK